MKAQNLFLKSSRLFSLLAIMFFAAAVYANNSGANLLWKAVGPSGGDARKVVVDPKDKNHLLMTTLDGQVYASYDAAKSWSMLVNFNRPQLVLDQLILDPRDSNIIYVSGHRHKEAGGFFKTTDGGKTWKESKDLKNQAIHSMIQSSQDNNYLLVGTVEGVWESTDAGENWKKIDSSSSPVNVNSLAVDPRNTDTIFAGTWWRAYKTTDGGKNWKLIKDGMIDDSDVFAIDIDTQNPDNVFASACSGIYFSENSGEKWTKVQGIPSTSRRTRDILQHPTIPGTIFAGTTEGLWVTRDKGKTWSLNTSRQLEVNSISVSPADPDKVYIATNNFGIMVSNDRGQNFVPTNGNLSTRLTYSIVGDIEKTNRYYATTMNTATGGGFIFVSDDNGKTWNPSVGNINTKSLSPYAILQDRKNANLLYLATNAGLFISTNSGLSWNQVKAGKQAPAKRASTKTATKTAAKTVAKTATSKTSAPAESAKTPVAVRKAALTERINTLAYLEDGKNGILAGTNSGLYRSYNVSAGWEKLSFGPQLNEQVQVIATSASDPNLILVGTQRSGVLVTKDGGATWAQIADIPADNVVSSIMVNPKNPDYVYVGTNRSFFMSRDGGQSWSRRGGNLPSGNFTSILVNPENPNEVFVSNEFDVNGGIYQSNNAGETWTRIDTRDTNLASRRFWTLAFDRENPNRLLAGSHSGGIISIERVTSANAAAGSNTVANQN